MESFTGYKQGLSLVLPGCSFLLYRCVISASIDAPVTHRYRIINGEKRALVWMSRDLSLLLDEFTGICSYALVDVWSPDIAGELMVASSKLNGDD